ncbi:MAG TPA: cytidine deaminase, partial [Chitinophagaceae bacterium]|nr:cytidine deaminase [Chitinophagaceae bacterium]
LLGTAATLHPDMPIKTMAISYRTKEQESDHPISPCGMCRQALLEYESRTSHPIRLILGGQKGKVFIITTVKDILPFAFTQQELK